MKSCSSPYKQNKFHLSPILLTLTWFVVANTTITLASPSNINKDSSVASNNTYRVVANREIKIKPNYSVVQQRAHLNKIRSMGAYCGGKEAFGKRKEYLSTLDMKGILETASEMAEDGNLIDDGVELIPYIKQKVASDGLPYSEFCSIIQDNKYNSTFRAFMIDILYSILKHRGDVANKEKANLVDVLLSLGENKSNDPGLRRYALLKIRRNLKKINASEEKRLYDVFLNKDAPDIARGAAITAMRRMESSNLEKALHAVLSNPDNYPDTVIRHAVVTAAKSGFGVSYVNNIYNIAISTTNKQLYGSSIYALGIIGGTNAICTLVNLYEQHQPSRLFVNAFKKNADRIKFMLNLDNDKIIISSGITAAKIGGICSAGKYLQKIFNNIDDKSLRKKSQEAIQVLSKTTPDKSIYKWEEKND